MPSPAGFGDSAGGAATGQGTRERESAGKNSRRGPGANDSASLRQDPFLTRGHVAGPPPTHWGYRDNSWEHEKLGEATPLADGSGDRPPGRGHEAKLAVLPSAICLFVQTIVTVAALAVALPETGHRDSYEEGHLGNTDRNAGCEKVFYWMMAQAILDAVVICFTVVAVLSPLRTGPLPVMMFGIAPRMITLGAGIAIIYFSGLETELCNSFLIVWSHVLIWLGVASLCCVSGCVLLAAAGNRPTRVGSGIPKGFKATPAAAPRHVATPGSRSRHDHDSPTQGHHSDGRGSHSHQQGHTRSGHGHDGRGHEAHQNGREQH